MKNIAIIGAGITGITTAYQLLERGYSVSVFDRELAYFFSSPNIFIFFASGACINTVERLFTYQNVNLFWYLYRLFSKFFSVIQAIIYVFKVNFCVYIHV